MMLRPILWLVCVLLALAGAWPWLATAPVQQQIPATSEAQSEAAFDFNDPARLESYTEFVSRPVFVASRRPAGLAPNPNRKAGEKLLLDRYPIVGVVINGQQRVILIRKAAGDTVSRIEQGAVLDGWTLTEVTRERLVLEMGANRKEIPLQNNSDKTD